MSGSGWARWWPQYSFRRNSAHADKFDVKFIHTRDYPYLSAREGQSFLRGGTSRVWHMADLQSFTPLRFLPPQLMNWQGRAVVTDPDVFAVGDVYELLQMDMRGAAVMGRHRSDKADKRAQVATSVMLLDCARLRHWDAAGGVRAVVSLGKGLQGVDGAGLRGPGQYRLPARLLE